MKKTLKIFILSLTLIFSAFLLSNTTKAANGDVKVQITSQTGYCIYGQNVDFNATGFSYLARSITTGFTTSSGDNIWFCEDSEGDSGWSVTLASTNLLNMGNTGIIISSGNLFVIAGTGTVVSGSCTAITGDSHGTPVPLSGTTAVTLFGKLGGLGQTCRVQSTGGIFMKLNIGSGQAPGQYSGLLTITLQNNFDGIPN